MEILIMSIVFVFAVVGYVMISVFSEWMANGFFRIGGNVIDGVKGLKIRRRERRERKERYERKNKKE